jgi:diphosphomevalonate decarboxylase
MDKVTTVAPANIAFIKYWGRINHELYIPSNNSISMNLSNCRTRTTVTFSGDEEDLVEVKFYGKDYSKLDKSEAKVKNIYEQIQRIRELSSDSRKVIVKSENSFPADAGIASSASGFAALTGALLLLYGLEDKFTDKKEFSRQVRLCGSGSAVRSVYGGFVEFQMGDGSHEDSYAFQVAGENHWDLVDIVAVVNPEKKETSSSDGHHLAETSPYFQTRLQEMQPRIIGLRKAIKQKDLSTLGLLIEEDSTSMHAVMMTSRPPIFYWAGESLEIMKNIRRWRGQENLQAFYTLDAGANVHVICRKKDASKVTQKLESLPFVNWTIYNENCEGVTVSSDHLF